MEHHNTFAKFHLLIHYAPTFVINN